MLPVIQLCESFHSLTPMSPRRMDISSLLRDPSPPRLGPDEPVHRHTDRPRTIDALLHHPQPPENPPPSLFSILNNLDSPSHRTPRTAHPHTSPHHPLTSPADHPPPRPPFLGFDALVHVASEERRRISAVSDRDTDLDRFTEQDTLPIRPNLPHDHDWPSRPYTYPLSSYPAPLHRQQDSSRPHKRARDTPPRSPSPDPRFPQLTSPCTRLHSSASPINNYPTLRRQLIEPSPSRSAPALLPINDTRTIPIQHTSPFLHSLHPLQLPTPRHNSPHHHSPQHFRSHHHSSPIHTPSSLISLSAEPDAMSPRYNHGPRMAGGIEVLSNDASSIRDAPRPDSSNYQSPGRDISERFVSESRLEHARHEPPKLSPLSGRTFSPDDDSHQPKPPPYQVEGQESVLLRERLRSHPPHLPLYATTDNSKAMGVPAVEPDSLGQPPPERHPIRVWEEQLTVRETSRRVSSAHMPRVVSDLAEGRSWSGANESGHGERLTKEGRRTDLRQDVVENGVLPLHSIFYSHCLIVIFLVPPPPLPTSKESPPPRPPTSEPLASDSRAPIEGNRLDPQPSSPIPMQPRPPIQSEPQTHLPQTLHPNSLTPRAPASPVLDLHLKNFETQSELQPKRLDTLVDASTGAPLTSPDPIITEPLSGKTKQIPDADNILMTNPLPRQLSPELAQLAKESGTFEISTYSTHVTVSHTSRSPSQHSLPILLPAKDEHGAAPEDVLVSPLIPPEPSSRRSPEPEYTSEREQPVLEQAMMDVDEELLSLVEDRPVRAVPIPSKVQIESKSPLPIAVGQGTGAGAEQGSSAASDGPSLVLSSQPVLKGPALMTDEEKDRASMPPPAARNKKAEKDKTSQIAGTATGGKKKKDGTSKVCASHVGLDRPVLKSRSFRSACR